MLIMWNWELVIGFRVQVLPWASSCLSRLLRFLHCHWSPTVLIKQGSGIGTSPSSHYNESFKNPFNLQGLCKYWLIVCDGVLSTWLQMSMVYRHQCKYQAASVQMCFVNTEDLNWNFRHVQSTQSNSLIRALVIFYPVAYTLLRILLSSWQSVVHGTCKQHFYPWIENSFKLY